MMVKNTMNNLIEKLAKNDVINALGDAVSIQDRNFTILYQNEKAKNIIGDHVGKYCYEAFEQKNHMCEGCPLQLTMKDGKIRTVEKRNLAKKNLIVEITTSPLKDSTGKIIAGIEVVRDITKRKRRDKEIQKSISELKDKLAKARNMEGIIHMCCSCNKVHDEESGNWTLVDRYIKDNSNAKLSHGYCPECAAKHFPPASLDS